MLSSWQIWTRSFIIYYLYLNFASSIILGDNIPLVCNSNIIGSFSNGNSTQGCLHTERPSNHNGDTFTGKSDLLISFLVSRSPGTDYNIWCSQWYDHELWLDHDSPETGILPMSLPCNPNWHPVRMMSEYPHAAYVWMHCPNASDLLQTPTPHLPPPCVFSLSASVRTVNHSLPSLTFLLSMFVKARGAKHFFLALFLLVWLLKQKHFVIKVTFRLQ